MDGSVILTGASRGIGYATAVELLRGDTDRHLISVGRGGRALARRLSAISGNPHIHPVDCDLSSLDSVRAAATGVAGLLDSGTVPPIAALLGNAGVQLLRTGSTTADGYEQTFGVNVLAHYLLIRLLADRIGPPGRIVLVTSSTHFGDVRHNQLLMPGPRWADPASLAEPRNGRLRSGQVAYTTSKLALIYLVHELARRLPDGVDAYSFNPGLVPGTGIARHTGRVGTTIWRHAAPLLVRLPGAVPVEVSAARLAAATVGPRPTETGGYLDIGRPTRSSARSYDPDRERELWTSAARLVGLAA